MSLGIDIGDPFNVRAMIAKTKALTQTLSQARGYRMLRRLKFWIDLSTYSILLGSMASGI